MEKDVSSFKSNFGQAIYEQAETQYAWGFRF